MLRTMISRLRGGRGFTLAETLIAILIMLMVSSIVAAGIPVAANAYYKVVDAANAQVLLSTTMTKLRAELGTAAEISVVESSSGGNTVITYLRASGNDAVICMGTEEATEDNPDPFPYPRIFLEIKEEYIENGTTKSKTVRTPLVSAEASSKHLYAIYDSVSYSDGVLTFTNITVKKEDKELAQIDSFQVRVITEACITPPPPSPSPSVSPAPAPGT